MIGSIFPFYFLLYVMIFKTLECYLKKCEALVNLRPHSQRILGKERIRSQGLWVEERTGGGNESQKKCQIL